MAGISSKAAGKLENRFKYNGNKLESGEFSDGSGLEVYDFNARTYDQQIGRFMQVDPLADQEDQESFTPYHFGFNNPILNSDPDGKQPIVPIIRALYYISKYAQETGVAPAVNAPRVLMDGTRLVRSPLPLNVRIEDVKPEETKTSGQTNSTPDAKKAQERADKLSEKQRDGKDFTKAGKDAVKDVNRAKNEGKMKCENCKEEVQQGSKHEKGKTPPKNEAQVDHVDAKASGGSGTPNNGQILCRGCNIEKGTKPVEKPNN